MAVESPAFGNQASTYGAEQTRRAVFFPFATTGGIKATGDLAVTAPVSGMTVNVATGEILVPGSSSSIQGVYYGRVSSSTSIVISTASPSNPRIDMIYAAITDAAYTGATNTFTVAVATGTPTSGATLTNLSGAPALPTSAIILAYCLVPTSATNIITADLSDQRVTTRFGVAGSVPNFASTTARDAALTAPLDNWLCTTSSGGTAATPRREWRYDSTAAAWILVDAWGTGTPEANVTATVGARYMQTDGGASTTLWFKTSGSSNTGWTAVVAAAGAMTQIASTTFSGSVGTVTYSSLGSYNQLLYVFLGRSATAATSDQVFLRMNADTAGNYNWETATVQNATMTALGGAADTVGAIGRIAAANGPANAAGALEIWVPGYATTTFQKRATGQYGYSTANSTEQVSGHGSCEWKNTAAITSLTFGTSSGANIVANSLGILYGIS